MRQSDYLARVRRDLQRERDAAALSVFLGKAAELHELELEPFLAIQEEAQEMHNTWIQLGRPDLVGAA